VTFALKSKSSSPLFVKEISCDGLFVLPATAGGNANTEPEAGEAAATGAKFTRRIRLLP
jgi:hypothetical protein